MVFWRGFNVFKNIEIAQGGVKIGLGGYPAPPTTDYFVDSTLGASGNSGLGWGTSVALDTISGAFTKANALGTRGRFRIFVAPGGYTEDGVTPINANAPFGQLIAVNPTTGHGYGAAWWTASTAGEAVLTIQARGWYVSGFEFDALADAECVILGGATTGARGDGAVIEDCLFVGQNQGLAGIDIQSQLAGCNLLQIRNNLFYGFSSGSTAGKCISHTNASFSQPQHCLIEFNEFADSENLIDFNHKGIAHSTIRYNTLNKRGVNQSATNMLDNQGGVACQIYMNKFAEPYTIAGGYVAGTNDNWAGNMAEAVSGESANGWTYADPAT